MTTFGLITSQLGHIASDLGWSHTPLLIGLIIGALAAALVLEHLYVKHGRLRLLDIVKPLAIILALALAATTAPAQGWAQGESQPVVITGTPTTVGDYSVVIRQIEADGDGPEIRFDWSIRPSTDIEFAL